MAGPPSYSGIVSGIGATYDVQRQKAAQQEGANLQGQKDVLQRRAAQLGGGPSGAFVKDEQLASDQSAQRLQQANEGINAQEQQAKQGVQMTQLGQQFQTSEREAGQGFQAGQTQAAQTFAAGQQEKQIAAQKVMQQTGIDANSSLQDRQIAAQKIMQQTGLDAAAAQQLVGIGAQKEMQGTQIAAQKELQKNQLDQQSTQFEKNFGLEEKKFAEQSGVDQFNEHIAQQMADKKDLLEQLFSNVGGANPLNPGSAWAQTTDSGGFSLPNIGSDGPSTNPGSWFGG